MSNKSLKFFVQLQKEIREFEGDLTPRYLYDELNKWGKSLSNSKDEKVRKLYTSYFAYFEGLDIKDYFFQPLWYDFNDLVKFDFFRPIPRDLEILVAIVRDIMWEIIAFKTDRNCKILDIDNLRALTNRGKQSIFFCCDNCGYMEDIEGRQVEANEVLYPATMSQILGNNISPGSP